MNCARSALATMILAVIASSMPAEEQEPAKAKESASSAVTEISADLGSCSVEFKVTDMKGNPVYNAKITTQIRYGFLSKRKLDLEAGTNADGRARFINMPDQVKNPIIFEGTYGGDTATMTWDPGTNCRAQYPMVLGKSEHDTKGS